MAMPLFFRHDHSEKKEKTLQARKQKRIRSEWIEGIIKNFTRHSQENSLGNEAGEKAWSEPIVGFSKGDDLLYDTLKNDIGLFYWTPVEIFTKAFSDANISTDQLSVISWILPQTERTKGDHRKQTVYPSERWVRARLFGEDFNNRLRRHVVETLRAAGYAAVAPMLSPFWKRRISEAYGFASNWSERHTAYVCGLGTFGLSDGLITPLGKAIRCGSVVARISVEPTKRPYRDHQTYCLFHSYGTCKKCIDRCPVGAITENGHDKLKCKNYLRQVMAPYVENQFGLKGHCCGLCQTAVPCESWIPGGEEG